MELAPLDPEDYCPRRATLGSGKNEKHPASKSAQAACFREYCKTVHFWPAFCLGRHLSSLRISLASLGGSHGKLHRVDAKAT